MMAKKKSKAVESSGKRKTAIARATVKAGKGRVRVNSEPIEILQPSLARRKAMEPLIIADAMNRLSKVDISITTTGGGIMGQTDAIRTAIARGLVLYNGGARVMMKICEMNILDSIEVCWSMTQKKRAKAPTWTRCSPKETKSTDEV